MSDGELVRRVLAGEVGAYEPLARRWAPRVMAVCHARLARADAAEDLAQETLLRGLRALPSLSDPEKFGPWLCGIAVRTCLDWLKASARTEVSMSALSHDREFAGTVEAAGASVSEKHDEIRRLMGEVEKLPLPYRQVLMQFYYEDCTYKQIAEQLGVSSATVNMRLTRARQILRERLVPREGGVSPQESHDAM
jgi:RNA polymerase sigma-70 factor (ECF subfamily)